MNLFWLIIMLRRVAVWCVHAAGVMSLNRFLLKQQEPNTAIDTASDCLCVTFLYACMYFVVLLFVCMALTFCLLPQQLQSQVGRWVCRINQKASVYRSYAV